MPKEYELNLISLQSDILIDQKLFNKKPECIKEWYAVNVVYNHKNLHHIPLGISEEFRNLPIHFFDDASKLNIEFLDSNSDLIEKLQNENQDKEYLFAEYWVKNIKKEKENNNEVEEMVIIIDENLEKSYFRKFFIIKTIKSNLKVVRFYIYQYLNIFIYFRFTLRKFDLIDEKSF